MLIASTLRCVGNMGLRGPIFCHNGHKIIKNSDLLSFSQKFAIGFTSFLVSMSIWATFRNVLNIGCRGPISGSFWAPKSIIIQVFIHFLKYFPWVSHNSCFYCGCFYMYSMMCHTGSISGPRVNVTAEFVRPSGLMLYDNIHDGNSLAKSRAIFKLDHSLD